MADLGSVFGALATGYNQGADQYYNRMVQNAQAANAAKQQAFEDNRATANDANAIKQQDFENNRETTNDTRQANNDAEAKYLSFYSSIKPQVVSIYNDSISKGDNHDVALGKTAKFVMDIATAAGIPQDHTANFLYQSEGIDVATGKIVTPGAVEGYMGAPQVAQSKIKANNGSALQAITGMNPYDIGYNDIKSQANAEIQNEIINLPHPDLPTAQGLVTRYTKLLQSPWLTDDTKGMLNQVLNDKQHGLLTNLTAKSYSPSISQQKLNQGEEKLAQGSVSLGIKQQNANTAAEAVKNTKEYHGNLVQIAKGRVNIAKQSLVIAASHKTALENIKREDLNHNERVSILNNVEKLNNLLKNIVGNKNNYIFNATTQKRELTPDAQQLKTEIEGQRKQLQDLVNTKNSSTAGKTGAKALRPGAQTALLRIMGKLH
jgi:hypothetical protein